MKAYTDFEQSKKLAEILPIESADMGYIPSEEDDDGNTLYTAEFKSEFIFDDDCCIQCWSLAALLGVLPTTIGNFFKKNALRLRMDKGENDFNIWYENFDCGDVAEGLDAKEDNPVDACYAMIIYLHEQKLL